MVTHKKRYRKKRLSKRGGVDTSSTVAYNDLPINNNLNNGNEDDTTSQGSLHLSDLNVTDDSNASGITTVESMSPDSFSPNNSFANLSINGGKKYKRRKTSKKRKNNKSKSKRRRSKSNKRSKKRGGANQVDEDTSPVSNIKKYNDMIDYFS
jgi:hypothetical protein